MRTGVAFPQTRIGTDPIAVRDFAQAVEELGFTHIEAYDHVLGANRAAYPDLGGHYGHTDAFYEPFALFGYLAGLTRSIELATGILILGQRQTALVAKQASVGDVLSRGRLRLGVGTGWSPVEYEALGENFHNRGRRSEEQVAVLRALWTRELVTFEGRWHTIRDAGICPPPVQRPIPVWFGGRADAVLERCGRLGDGWIQLYFKPDDACRRRIDAIREAARGAGRDPMAIGLESWVSLGGLTPDDWTREAAAWRALGMTHLTVNTEFTGLHHLASDVHGVEGHVALLRTYKDAVGDLT